MAENKEPIRDEKGRVVKGGGSLNPSGTPKEVRELHALVRTGIPKAFEKALAFLDNEDPAIVKIGMDWIGKFGLPVPAMKSSKDGEGERRDMLTPDEIRAFLRASSKH